MKVKLPKPCNQDFNIMPLDGNGRRCSSCQKVVTDFTKMSLEEIKHYFLDDKNQQICGIFKAEHIGIQPRFYERTNFIFNKFYRKIKPIALSVVLSCLFSQCKSTKIIKQTIEIKDYDSDGLVGKEDECEHSAGTKEFHGCPDTDKDGIGDSRDREPLSPEGYPVDDQGIAKIPKPFDPNEYNGQERVLMGIPPMRESTDEHRYHISYGKGELSTQSSEIKRYLETIIKDYKYTSYFEVNIIINDVLDLKRNIKLKERVQLMRSYLIKGGVPKSDIKISSNQHVDKNDISIATRGR